MGIVVFHGTKGSPQGNWFPWLKTQFPDVIVPQFPTPDGQNKDNWLRYVPKFDADTILIGHSCGATFLLHVLEHYAAKQSIFVSPVMGELGLPQFDELNVTFYDHDFDWATIKKNAGRVHILHGDNDPYVPAAHAQRLHESIGGTLTIIPGGGHLNKDAGFAEFPALAGLIG